MLLWAAILAVPLATLFAAAVGGAASGLQGESITVVTLYSFAWAAGLAAVAVVLGYVPGRVLGTASRSWQVVLFFLMLTPLVLPRHVLYYAWTLPLSPTTALGRYLGQHPDWARRAGALTSSAVMILWYWPLAALLIAQGWRNLDPDVLSGASLDAGRRQKFVRVTLPLLARPLMLAFGVCFALALSEFGTFHLAGIRTVGTELAVLYEMTGSEAAVARAAWPLALVAAVVGVLLWRRAEDWSTRPPVARVRSAAGAWRWCVAAGLIGLSFGVPVALLAGAATSASGFARFFALHWDELAWSLLTSSAAAALALVIAAGALTLGRLGRAARRGAAVVLVVIFVAMFLPGSLIGVALLKTLSALRAPSSLRQAWYLLSAGQAARFAGLVLIVLLLARESKDRHLGEAAAVDGASWLRTWIHVHLPRVWPLPLGVFLLAVMLGLTELPVTMVLLPAGLPNFAQRLLNQMHYARDQQVIASCLILISVYVVLAVLVVLLLRMVKGRSRPLLAVLCLMGLAAGCDLGVSASDGPRVLKTFGRTGSGSGEFLYPRAIDRAADGTLFVVDKTGRIQQFGAQGEPVAVIQMPLVQAGKPTGLSVGLDGNLYVADTHYHRVTVFSADGTKVDEFGRFGEGDGCFIYPTDVAFAGDGRIFVSEYGGNDRVSVFSKQREFLLSFGSQGDGRGQFARPAALCVDRKRQRLYVADACNHRIAKYDLDGRLLGYVGAPGRGKGQLRYPYDLALLSDGTLVVCEFGNNRLQLFSPEGKALTTYGGPGRSPGRLAYPWGVVVDEERRAYVVDAGNNRVQVWQL